MRFVIQRVSEASVTVDGQIVGQIGKGFMVLVGVAQTDTEAIADKLVKKMAGLRIFEDELGKTNLSLADVGGALLMVSQFTLYADCRRGNRPGFSYAGKPEQARNFPNLPILMTIGLPQSSHTSSVSSSGTRRRLPSIASSASASVCSK